MSSQYCQIPCGFSDGITAVSKSFIRTSWNQRVVVPVRKIEPQQGVPDPGIAANAIAIHDGIRHRMETEESDYKRRTKSSSLAENEVYQVLSAVPKTVVQTQRNDLIKRARMSEGVWTNQVETRRRQPRRNRRRKGLVRLKTTPEKIFWAVKRNWPRNV